MRLFRTIPLTILLLLTLLWGLRAQHPALNAQRAGANTPQPGMNAPQPDWNKYTDTKERLAAIRNYGADLVRKQQFAQAIPVFLTGLTIARQASLDSFTSSNLYLTGNAYRYRSKYDSAIYYLTEGKRIADKGNYTRLQALVRMELFSIYNRLGKGDSAALEVKEVTAMIPRLDSNGNERARLELALGHEAKHRAKYDEALQHYYRALNIFSYLKDSMNIGTIYISLANVMVIMGQSDKALNYHREAAALLTRLGRLYELGNELLNITDLYYTSDHLDSAEASVRRALEIALALNEKTYEFYAYMHLGNIYKRRKDFPAAENYLDKSVTLGESMGMESALIESYQGLGEMYMSQKLPLKAKPYLEKHLALAKKDHNQEELTEAVWDLAENQYALHQYKEAYDYQKQYLGFRDSTYNSGVSREMAELESKYQNEKKEEQIMVLKKDQQLSQLELQKHKNFQIGLFLFFFFLLLVGFLLYSRNRVVQRVRQEVEMEKMRNNIARDLHDDIGSTLTSINILSKVALQQANGNTAVNANLAKIKERSGAIMESMGDIVWAINPQNDTMEKLVSRMKQFLAEMLEPLNINYSFKEEGDFSVVKMDVKKRKDFFLLFKEAVHNAARHSGCSNIQISLRQDQQHLQLKVMDDGAGFRELEVRAGNGLSNMRARAKSMQASFSIDTAPGKGADIRLVTPIT